MHKSPLTIKKWRCYEHKSPASRVLPVSMPKCGTVIATFKEHLQKIWILEMACSRVSTGSKDAGKLVFHCQWCARLILALFCSLCSL